MQSVIHFDADGLEDLKAKQYVEEKLKELSDTEHEGKFAVVLHNDPLNGVEFVTKVIKSVFGYGTSKAIWLMLKAHVTGSSVLWVGPKSIATEKQNEMVAFGPDPMVEKATEALKVTVEACE